MSRASRDLTAAGWVTLAVAGQGAALSLITAGKSVGYQHYIPLSELTSRPLAALVLALQAVAVVWGMRGAASALLAHARKFLTGWRLPVFALVMVLSSATVGRDIPRYVGELALSSAVQLLGILSVVLAVRSIGSERLGGLRRRFDALLGEDVAGGEAVQPKLDRFAWVTAALVTVVCAALAVLVYQRHPHLQDEVAYLFQARTFATGHLALPSPPVPAA
ncbi:MAG TPA: hypothetical protein VGI92_08130, partial [Gemmatimonadales bacterium]